MISMSTKEEQAHPPPHCTRPLVLCPHPKLVFEGGSRATLSPLPIFPSSQTACQPTACTLTLWWIKFGPTKCGMACVA